MMLRGDVHRLFAEGLTAQRGDTPALAPASFTVKAGEALALRGPNGAGKSTLLRVLAGLLPCSGGALGFADGSGQALPADTVRERSLILVAHQAGLREEVSAAFQLRIEASLRGVSREAVTAALTRAGLSDDLHTVAVGRLSAGQLRRAALARLFLGEARIWLLDEADASLDGCGLAMLGEAVRIHRAGGGMVVAAVHSSAEWLGEHRSLSLSPVETAAETG